MYTSRYSFVSKLLKEISIIVILIFCLNYSVSKFPLFLLINYQFTELLLMKILVFLKNYVGINKIY